MTITFTATIKDLQWCRVDDVLRWIHTNDDGDLLEFFVDDIGNPERCPTIAIPCNEFTASVIARAAMNIKPSEFDDLVYWCSVRYRKNLDGIFCLNFWGVAGIYPFYGSFPMPINPDQKGEKTDWTRAKIDDVLDGMK